MHILQPESTPTLQLPGFHISMASAWMEAALGREGEATAYFHGGGGGGGGGTESIRKFWYWLRGILPFRRNLVSIGPSLNYEVV